MVLSPKRPAISFLASANYYVLRNLFLKSSGVQLG